MIILDVREKEEFQVQSIPDSICCPMSQMDVVAPGILKAIKEKDVVVMCRSGNRARIALDELKKIDADQHNFSVYTGGIIQWKAEGRPVVGSGFSFPMMRQVQIAASSMIFLAFLLAHYYSPGAIYLALFVGMGLAMSGWLGVCPMVYFLQRMPWNKKSDDTTNTAQENCCG